MLQFAKVTQFPTLYSTKYCMQKGDKVILADGWDTCDLCRRMGPGMIRYLKDYNVREGKIVKIYKTPPYSLMLPKRRYPPNRVGFKWKSGHLSGHNVRYDRYGEAFICKEHIKPWNLLNKVLSIKEDE